MPRGHAFFPALRVSPDDTVVKVRVSQKVNFALTAVATYSATAILPGGSDFRSITLDTPVAISGGPTSCMFRAGTALAGQQVVADVDAKAQGHIAATIVAALDKGAMAAAADTTIFMQIVTTGGTTPTGTIECFVEYDAPAF